MKKIRVDMEFEVTKAVEGEEEGDWFVEGFAATSDLDLQDEILAEGALKEAVGDLLENPTVFLNHDIDKPIGKVVEATFRRGKGLFIKVLISKTVADVWTQIKEGVLSRFSIRAVLDKVEEKWSESLQRIVRFVESLTIREVSVVSLPANPKAQVLTWYIMKALQEVDNMLSESLKQASELIVKLASAEMMEENRLAFDEVKILLEQIGEEAQKPDPAKAKALTERLRPLLTKLTDTEVNDVAKKHLMDLQKLFVKDPTDTGKTADEIAAEKATAAKAVADAKKAVADAKKVGVDQATSALDTLITAETDADAKKTLEQLKEMLTGLVGETAEPDPQLVALTGQVEALTTVVTGLQNALKPLLDADASKGKTAEEIAAEKAAADAADAAKAIADKAVADAKKAADAGKTAEELAAEAKAAVDAQKSANPELAELTKVLTTFTETMTKQLPRRKGLQTPEEENAEEAVALKQQVRDLIDGKGIYARVSPGERLRMVLAGEIEDQ